MKKLLTFSLVLIMALTVLTACGAKGPHGTYYGYIAGYQMYEVTFNNGKCTSSFLGEEKRTGEYTMDGNEIFVENDDDTVDYYTYDPTTDTLSALEGLITYSKD